MIAANFKDHKRYLFNEGFEKAFNFIAEFIKSPLEKGRYEIDADNVFAMVQEYEPSEASRAETHKKYIDIQFIAKGSEIIKWADVTPFTVEEDMTPQKDVVFYKDDACKSTLILSENDFAIFFPEDLHMPGLVANDRFVKKIVIKIKA